MLMRWDGWRRVPRAFRRWHGLSPDERRLVLAALRLWPTCKLTLRRRGFHAAQARLFGTRFPGGPAAPDTSVSARRVAQLVDGLTRRLPGKASCLERSLLTASLLHDRGLEPQVEIGVRQGPGGVDFHAWVTVGTEVVNDGESRVGEYTRLAAASPRTGL